MIIRPGLEDFIEKMVGCDPLYIIDRDYDLLQPSIERFPKTYQNRLRTYTTNDWSEQPILERIPNNQFGVCLACNVFNYRPLEIIRRYLEEIYTKLRPGGALLMTYNDCDRAQAVMLVEQFCASYTPGYLIQDLAQSVGFELVYTWSNGGPSVWLELHKPGPLLSNRGGQALARIYTTSDYLDDIDFLKRKAYTQEEIDILFEKAENLGVDQDQQLSLKPFELQLLINNIINELHQKELAEREHQRITALAELARQYNINVNLTNWQELVIIEQRKHEAMSFSIDVSNSNWEYLLEQKLEEIEKERLRLQEEERRIAEELERKRVEELHLYARSLGIEPTEFTNENEIHRRIAEEIDKLKKQELVLLRQRAMELKAGDPNLIRYGYSAEKLKQLIKAKENK
jgi:SAM-dependent methyltransferase